MKLTIAAIDAFSSGLKRVTFKAPDGAELPGAGPGAHVIVEIPGPARIWRNAYSLTSIKRDAYRIIVRRVEKSRGGSAWLHANAKPGDMLEVSAPQNFFAPNRTAKKHLLLSAGIGITPFLAYLEIPGLNFELHQCCRAEDAAAFRALLPAAPNVTLHTSRNTLNLHELLGRQKLDTHLSICGPEAFMAFAIATAKSIGWPADKIHSESFGGATGGAPFTVHLRRSKRSIAVGAEESLLDAMEAAGLAPPCLCRGGACGECEMAVLEGVPEHHDHYLSPEKRAANTAIMICVSRARTPELVLDY